jgi:hypothetical protein
MTHAHDNSSQCSVNPSPDQCAAHEFLTELRTRIATQTLPYQYGVEARALESLWELFGHARNAMKKYPGCEKFADAATRMLNEDLRPVTAKWHKAFVDGRLNSKDGADEFRGDLAEVQKKLKSFAGEMHQMAYGSPQKDQEDKPVLTDKEFKQCLEPLSFGIPQGFPASSVVDEINKSEAGEIKTRRTNYEIKTTEGEDAVGMAFSGGGIRSATFCLGVTQVLADKQLLKDVDFLSTVSGGGYTGSFITRRLGEGTPCADLAHPKGPDPAPIQYLRHHAEFLLPVNLRDSWSMVTATFAGMLLNWTVPLLVIVFAALAATFARPLYSGKWLIIILAGTVALSGIALIPYCILMRKGERPARFGGRLIGVLAALAVLLGALWLIALGYQSLPKWIASFGAVSGGLGALIAAGPAIIRFVPVLKTPSVRKIAMQILLVVAGVIVPIIAIIVLYGCVSVGEIRPQSSGGSAPGTDTAAPSPVFISYAKEDFEAADRLRAFLEKSGCTVWFNRQPTTLSAGTPLSVELENKISHECCAFLSLISTTTEGAGNGGYLAERNLAALRARKIADPAGFYFPVVIDSRLAPRVQGFKNEPHPVRQLQSVWCPRGTPPEEFSLRLAEVQSTRPRLERIINRRFKTGFDGRILLACILGVLFFVDLFVLNINLTAPHRLYRDRLAKTFIQKAENLNETIPLSGINPDGRAPYHLINCALNLPSSTNPALRDRRCDFFVFSKHWCGSPMTGYRSTGLWLNDGSEIDLASAMAISGAAASSHMGLGTMPTLTALLTFFNVRLGFWLHHPDKRRITKAPGFTCLIREMTGIAMSEKRAWLNLSDGGHIENMAVYELLKRRCKFVICVDGEEDASFNFGGLMTLVRHAQIDLGVRIEPRLNELRPDPKTGYSATHAAFCRIHYPALGGQPEGTGLLLYMKLSVTGNETELIRRYRTNHPEFPHQKTLDQFFDQEQFEAYRQLGVHVADGLFSRSLMNGAPSPASIPEWFQRLAKNLLEPEFHS